jgi:apolipoprotein N-acyltransferase
LILPGLPPVGPSICYESIFPGNVVAKGADHPQWIAIITNDGWFGNSAGPYQHFAAARLRAIEEGLPVARAANTGISGVIDAYGRVVTRLDLGLRGHVDGGLPKPAPNLTLYARFGDLMAVLTIFPFLVIAFVFRRRN